MIAYIEGEIRQVSTDYLILDHQGIGFRIFMPGSMLERFTIGQHAKIHTHYHVREDAVILFGFTSEANLRLFGQLINVNGIGPKAALGILSALTPEELQMAILAEDVSAISKAPGIGKKTAQKLILELKDKLSISEVYKEQIEKDITGLAGMDSSAMSEAIQALSALGYSPTDAAQAVNRIENRDAMATEDILKAALKQLI